MSLYRDHTGRFTSNDASHRAFSLLDLPKNNTDTANFLQEHGIIPQKLLRRKTEITINAHKGSKLNQNLVLRVCGTNRYRTIIPTMVAKSRMDLTTILHIFYYISLDVSHTQIAQCMGFTSIKANGASQINHAPIRRLRSNIHYYKFLSLYSAIKLINLRKYTGPPCATVSQGNICAEWVGRGEQKYPDLYLSIFRRRTYLKIFSGTHFSFRRIPLGK